MIKTKTKTIVAIALVALSIGATVAGLYYFSKLFGTYRTTLHTVSAPNDQTQALAGYNIQAKMSGTQTCDSGLVSGTSANCAAKHVSAFDTASVATINTSNDSVTVKGYNVSSPDPVCTNTVTMTNNGDKFIGPFGSPAMSGTATCSASGITYTAYGEKSGTSEGGSSSDPSCSASFSPNPIIKGQTAATTWTSTGDADGQIQYVCKCADGQCGSVAVAFGGQYPDIYETGILSSASGSTSGDGFSPPEKVNCVATVVNSAGVKNTCSATLDVTASPASAYNIQAKMSGTQTCDSGLVSGTSANCAAKHVSAFDTASVATINTSNDSVTVKGYNVSSPDPVCTNTVTMTNNGDKFIGPFGSPAMSGTATCSASGITYTAYGEKSGGMPPSAPSASQASCSFTFNPDPITKGTNVASTWTSTGDADGRIQYICKCADGQCESVNTAYGGQLPDIYEKGELGASGTTTTFSPPETVNCTMTVADSANVQNTCTGMLTVNSSTLP